ncbi:hypothetical protein INR49_014282 [Caranx melampygus]|nr:hypothetical protein INR49_014282 [Caranx melampygus]
MLRSKSTPLTSPTNSDCRDVISSSSFLYLSDDEERQRMASATVSVDWKMPQQQRRSSLLIHFLI